MKTKTIEELRGVEFNRLTLRWKFDSLLVWNAPDVKSEFQPGVKTISDFYDDGWDKWFVFFTEDCFDPPLYLINARTWEEAYDIFVDEFADVVDFDEIESMIKEQCFDWVREHDVTYKGMQFQRTPEDHFNLKSPSDQKEIRQAVEDNFDATGQISIAPSGARTPGGSPWRYTEAIQGFAATVVKAERVGVAS